MEMNSQLLDNYTKYAYLLLKKGLCVKRHTPLLIHAPVEAIDFIRVLTDIACNMGIDDIYYDWYDDALKYTQLSNYSNKSIKKSLFWNRCVHDEYAKKGAAFLFLISDSPGMMDDVSSSKLRVAAAESLKTRKFYRKLQANNEVDWCIAAVATDNWGKTVFPKSNNPCFDLWQEIFDICLINTADPLQSWNDKMRFNTKLCNKLGKLNIKELHYSNKKGTNLTIGLPENAIWCGGGSIINNRKLIVNIPTEEVFTTPNKYLTNGVVYASRPLIHSDVIIKDICLKFENGRVVDYFASSGLAELKNIIETDNESAMLGECALVDKNTRIAKSNLLFYETLFDENAACHIALGAGFKECLLHGNSLDKKQLEELGYNKSKNHVDIMIGTDDLNIVAVTYDNREIVIFKDGSFNI